MFSQQISKRLHTDEIRDCLELFSRYTSYDTPKLFVNACTVYIEAGYEPSADDWIRVLRCPDLEVDEFLTFLEISPPPPFIEREDLAIALVHFFARTGGPDQAEELFVNYTNALAKSQKHPSPRVYAAIIAARSIAGDVGGAAKWFEFWRTGKETHPFGYLEDQERHRQVGRWLVKHRELQKRSLRAAHISLDDFHTPYDNNNLEPSSVGTPIHASPPYERDDAVDHVAGQSPVNPTTEIARPASDPYIALLDTFTKAQNRASLRMVEILTNDRVYHTTKVYKSLMTHELQRNENMRDQSVLALYEELKASDDPACQVYDGIFALVYKAYREPRRTMPDFKYNPIASPSKLAVIRRLRPPPQALLENPRQVFKEMVQWSVAKQISSNRRLPSIYSKLLDLALGAFLRTRDYDGAVTVLSAYTHFKCQPTIATHVTTTTASFRAHEWQQGFLTPSGQAYLTASKKQDLKARIKHLQALAGGPKASKDLSARVQAEVHEDNDPRDNRDHKLVEGSGDSEASPSSLARTSAAYWNGRTVPRSPARLRDTRRYELRDTEYLKELLYYAGSLAGHPQLYKNRLGLVAEEMGLPDIRLP